MHEGSSPHARGAPQEARQRQVRAGLIPARAGSTVPAMAAAGCARAHPRTRGEHYTQYSDFVSPSGSSPHARGARLPTPAPTRSGGLIPARAGSTSCSGHSWSTAGAHPRTRGEHEQVLLQGVATVGSSPHARGAHFLTSMFADECIDFHSLFVVPGMAASGADGFSVSAGLAPSCAGSALLGVVGVWATHEVDTVEFDRFPFVAVHFEGQSLFGPCRVDHDGATVFRELSHSLPCKVTNAGGQNADEYSWADFEQPPSQVTPQPSWTRTQDEYYHGISSSS